jgi:hypothetical protein
MATIGNKLRKITIEKLEKVDSDWLYGMKSVCCAVCHVLSRHIEVWDRRVS